MSLLPGEEMMADIPAWSNVCEGSWGLTKSSLPGSWEVSAARSINGKMPGGGPNRFSWRVSGK